MLRQQQNMAPLIVGIVLGLAVVAIAFRDALPPSVRTFALGAAVVACGSQWITSGSDDQVNALALDDAAKLAQLKQANAALVQAQALATAEAEAQQQWAILQQIAAQPVALQEALLQEYGFQNLIPLLRGEETNLGVLPPSPPTLKSAAIASPAERAWEPEPVVREAFSLLPERDLAQDFVTRGQCNLLIGGESGAGKSNLTLGVANEALQAGAEIHILDGKNSDIFNALRQHPRVTYTPCAGLLDGAELALFKLDELIEKMLHRSDSLTYQPVLILLDELNCLLDDAVGVKLGDRERTASASIKAKVRKLLNQGRTRSYQCVITSHTLNENTLGLGAGSFFRVAMGRQGDWALIDEMMSTIKTGKAAIEADIKGIRSNLKKIPVALTDLPKPGLYRLPFTPRDGYGAIAHPPSAEAFAEAAGLEGEDELMPSERLDDTADLINLREDWQAKGPWGDGELLARWNLVAERKLRLADMNALAMALELPEEEFQQFLTGALD